MEMANCDPSIHHFSHPHPLELQVSNPQQQSMNTVPCSGCKLKTSATFYACKSCNYILHISCSKMPQCISHPADPNHTLSLLPVPAYPEGYFDCDACGRPGCNFCEFDAHLDCARTNNPKIPMHPQLQPQPIYQQLVQRTAIPQYQYGPQFRPAYILPNRNNPNQVVYRGVGPHQRNSPHNDLFKNVLQNLASGAIQELVQDITGCGSCSSGGGSGGGGSGGGGSGNFISTAANHLGHSMVQNIIDGGGGGGNFVNSTAAQQLSQNLFQNILGGGGGGIGFFCQ
ncbi:hypothetical protein NE237_030987 [Protea cynaroides]|uniref:DC1 domain-containing protein n=1 Tax=Protea cynaroides TaxID=273540 RepID=A0A9Q0JXH1_9MAGN|nr:hypothetical protein NE237_030987 [Protea cynaroides]